MKLRHKKESEVSFFGESLEASRTTDTVYTIKIRKEGIPGAAT